MSAPKRPMAVMMAHAAGLERADEWLERVALGTVPASSFADWRAQCRAAAVSEYAGRTDCNDLVAEWERGFDDRLSEAAAYRSPTPSQFHIKTIKRLADQASAVAAMLSVLELLSPSDQPGVLAACTGIADDIARNLLALRGAV